MNEPTITCPKCRHEIKLTESLAAPLIEDTRRQFEQQIAAKDDEILRREAGVKDQLAELERSKANLETEVSRRLDSERGRMVAEETARATRAAALDVEQRDKALAEANRLLKDREAKLAEAQQAQAALLRKERELDDAKREMELTIERSVQASLSQVRDKAKLEAEEGLSLKMREKEEQIANMLQQIEDLKRKAEQGSQQAQGEAHELELEETLRRKFPHDLIEPVPKGEFGGDVLQRVVGPGGQACGAILWEAKRTRNWSEGWLAKLGDAAQPVLASGGVLTWDQTQEGGELAA